MQKITSFDKNTLRQLRTEMQQLLSKYGEGLDLEFEVGNMRFEAAKVNISVEAKIKGAKTMEEVTVEYRLNVDGIEKINAKGEELIGFNGRRKKCWEFRRPDGKTFIADINYVKANWPKKKA